MPSKVTIYRESDSSLRLSWHDRVEPIDGELADGYRISEDRGGRLCIFASIGQLRLTVEQAMKSGVLTVASPQSDG